MSACQPHEADCNSDEGTTVRQAALAIMVWRIYPRAQQSETRVAENVCEGKKGVQGGGWRRAYQIKSARPGGPKTCNGTSDESRPIARLLLMVQSIPA